VVCGLSISHRQRAPRRASPEAAFEASLLLLLLLLQPFMNRDKH
jgi:hypothetical protein